jgi:hypothetical protein
VDEKKGRNFPLPHIVHGLEPLTLLYVPGLHGMHEIAVAQIGELKFVDLVAIKEMLW